MNASGNVTTARSVDFWYFCSIDNPQGTVIEVFAPLTLNGWVGALCTSGGIFSDEQLEFGLFAQIVVYTQDATQTGFGVGQESMLDLDITHGLFGGGETDNYYFDYATYAVRSSTSFGIKSGGVLLRLSVNFSVLFNEAGDDSGNPGNELWCDFADNRLNYFIQSPYLQLQVNRPGTQATA